MNEKKTLVLPLLMIIIGCGWLLTAMGFVPGIDWLWTLGIAGAGLMCFVVGGFDKITLVAGGFTLAASLLSVLRQTGGISLNIEVPVLVIIAGVLMLIARSSKVPMPTWTKEMQNDPRNLGSQAGSNDKPGDRS